MNRITEARKTLNKSRRIVESCQTTAQIVHAASYLRLFELSGRIPVGSAEYAMFQQLYDDMFARANSVVCEELKQMFNLSEPVKH